MPEHRAEPRAAATIAGLIARELGRLAYDRAVRRTGIPATVEDLDAAYLGAVLGRRVDDMEVLDGTEGTTDRVRVALRGDGVPATAFVKMAATSTAVRVFGNLADLGGDEVRFYRDVRPGLDLEVPQVHGIDHDPRTRRFVLVLEDLGARGCTFPELVDAVTVDQAAAGLDVLARLHGAHWRDPALDDGPRTGRAGDLRWVRANSADPLLPLFTTIVQRLAGRLASQHGELVGPGGRAILARYPAIAVAIRVRRPTSSVLGPAAAQRRSL